MPGLNWNQMPSGVSVSVQKQTGAPAHIIVKRGSPAQYEISLGVDPESGDQTFYTAGLPELSYRDDAGAWHNSTSFGEFDLECLALAALAAKKKIRQLKKTDREPADAQP